MFILLKGFEEVVIFGEGLVSSCSGHVVSTILKFFSPKCDWLLSFIPRVGINERLEFLIGGDLPFLFKTVSHSEVLVDVFNVNSSSVLIIHDQPADYVLCEWFGDECVSIGCCENTSAGLLLALFLFFAYLLSNLL